MSVFIFLIILLVLVLVHEFGHFFTAKKFGIRVDEFGFGFPPKVFGFKRGETEYTFNLLPLGGFVKIFGENPDDDLPAGEAGNINGPEAGRSFINKPKWQQAVVLFAGVFANFLLAWLLFSFGFMSGMPASLGNEPEGYALEDVSVMVVSVAPESPAFRAGLKTGDRIISLAKDGVFVSEISVETVKSFITGSRGEEVEFGYRRGGGNNLNFVKITPAVPSPEAEPKIGISMDQIGIAKLPAWLALKEGLSLTLSVTKGTALSLYSLIREGIKGQGSLESVTGPVGLVGVVKDAYVFGFSYLLSFTALISINLAVINLIPFPALDGGRLFFLALEKIKGSPIDRKFFNLANMVGFAILILFMIIVTYHDVTKLF